MKYINKAGEVAYFNGVTKGGKLRWVVVAASGQTLRGRDRQKLKSRTFTQEHQARAFLERTGYEVIG